MGEPSCHRPLVDFMTVSSRAETSKRLLDYTLGFACLAPEKVLLCEEPSLAVFRLGQWQRQFRNRRGRECIGQRSSFDFRILRLRGYNVPLLERIVGMDVGVGQCCG